ncbi:MAG: 16S rRNA (cytosine(1402)-N(4))-methyltransferase RsmH [Candidatus Nealsonbacteria bacterium]|nr:16S rRNA (cytosine(1402)-N(4))-methyltransferase RsmH [Candidatus Nealsonbacteria bacterium]
MHIPVLQKEVIKYLDPKPNENFIDCTVGEGGHASAILEKNGPKGKILGIDRDPGQIKNLKFKIKNWEKRIIPVCDDYVNLGEIVKENKFGPVSGILFDIGMSSWHLEESGRGFSFKRKEPLDMRFNANGALTAEKIVNYWSKFDIEKILQDYGEEKKADRIAQKIIEARKLRPIANTLQLGEIINKAGASSQQTFQALRIAVNDELNNLSKALPQAVNVLETGGRLVVISFHSLEDRIVKNFFKNPSFTLLTKKPVVPDLGEIRTNPRSRSAKLRAIKKI